MYIIYARLFSIRHVKYVECLHGPVYTHSSLSPSLDSLLKTVLLKKLLKAMVDECHLADTLITALVCHVHFYHTCALLQVSVHLPIINSNISHD